MASLLNEINSEGHEISVLKSEDIESSSSVVLSDVWEQSLGWLKVGPKLQDESLGVRQAAQWAIRFFPWSSALSSSALKQALKWLEIGFQDKEDIVRLLAQETLSSRLHWPSLPPDVLRQALEWLEAGLRDENEYIRLAAQGTLSNVPWSNLPQDIFLQTLKYFDISFQDEGINVDIRFAAYNALSKLLVSRPEVSSYALGWLETGVNDENPRIRQSVQETLGYLCWPALPSDALLQALNWLEAGIRDQNEYVRHESQQALGHLLGTILLPPDVLRHTLKWLEHGLRDENEQVRRAALKALGNLPWSALPPVTIKQIMKCFEVGLQDKSLTVNWGTQKIIKDKLSLKWLLIETMENMQSSYFSIVAFVASVKNACLVITDTGWEGYTQQEFIKVDFPTTTITQQYNIFKQHWENIVSPPIVWPKYFSLPEMLCEAGDECEQQPSHARKLTWLKSENLEQEEPVLETALLPFAPSKKDSHSSNYADEIKLESPSVHTYDGEPIFTYKAYRSSQEIGTVKFYRHPLLCRSEDGLRHNILEVSGIFKEANLNLSNVEEICASLPPTFLEHLAKRATLIVWLGASRGVGEVTRYAAEQKGISEKKSWIMAGAVYYSSFYLSRLYQYYSEELEAQREPTSAMWHATSDTAYLLAVDASLQAGKQLLHWLGNKAETHTWKKTAAGLKKLGSWLPYTIFARNAYADGVVSTAVSTVAGVSTQLAVEHAGKKAVDRVLR
jgi:hypothetical protein